MTTPDPDREVEMMIARAMSSGAMEMTPNPRCKVCRNEAVRVVTNKMIALGTTLADIMRTLEPINRTLDPADRINYDILWRHRRKDFDVQSPALAVHRAIAERRAAEEGKDWQNGVGNIVNHLAYLESMMVKGYETLIDESTTITAKEGLEAAMKLDDYRRRDEGSIDKAQLVSQMSRVINVVRQFIPREQWPALQAALAGNEEEVAPILPPQRSVEHVEMIPIAGDDGDFDG